jgi:DNA-binding transcriptional ArsR family regulator
VTESTRRLYRELQNAGEIKAFAHPLRIRILHVLADCVATNQEIAAELVEPPARVFHHLHALSDAGLIELVETRISGKNVEKFYRATARHFILRPEGGVFGETRVAALGVELDRIRHEALESSAIWHEASPQLLRQAARLHPDRLAAFHERLRALVHEFWPPATNENGELPKSVLTILTYREPPDSQREPGSTTASLSDE